MHKLLLAALSFAVLTPVTAGQLGRITQGALLVRGSADAKLECPLKRTDVKASISGPLAHVTVTQEFLNNATDTIEAIYVFPLPHNAAVDNMNLLVGNRVVKGAIRKRDEARAIYEAARNSGRAAALLDQERPNVFTQSVANIRPGETVRIEISYIERVPYEAGTYEFVFPMVVGPRYNPAGTRDAARITPPVAPPTTRAGHDVTISVTLDAGVPIDWVASSSHEVISDRPTPSQANIRLRQQAVIPNKDFVLRYDVAGKRIQDALLTHRSDRGGFFTLMLQPPERVVSTEVRPKEIVFVLDTSGSMSGFPIEKAKEAMGLALAALNPGDTFNLITFAGDTHLLFARPVPATRENLARAKQFLRGSYGSGGTEMMKAIRAALDTSLSRDSSVRVVCFMTDGYVGNEDEIIAEVKAHPNARVFSFGIGSSVNRYLLDKMAQAGRGEVEYVALNDDGSAAAKRFHERVQNPLLTDISIEWNGVAVTDVLPARIPDLFSAKPLVIAGRYSNPGKGSVRVRGKLGGAPFVREIPVEFPASAPRNNVLAALWARTRVDSLLYEPGSEAEVTRLGLDFRLMTPFTSFVAVEDAVINEGGKARTVQVPVEIPDGVNYDGIFGDESAPAPLVQAAALTATPFVGNAVVQRMQVLTGRGAERRAAMQAPPSRIDSTLRSAKGTVRVQIWLRDTEAATLAALKKLGFELTGSTRTAKLVIGRVDASRLEALAALTAVKWIAPAP